MDTLEHSVLSGRGYLPLVGHYDELSEGPQQFRGHWLEFFDRLESLGDRNFARRWNEVHRLIRDNGVTFNVYGDPRGRLWELDPLPVLFEENEWNALEAGMVQRATLLDRILEDVYGAQDLLKNDLLPPELVFCHPGFLRSCHGLCLPPSSRLLLYAADLGRTPQGQLLVLRDRTQSPPGAGYALENRLVVARMLPEIFRECHVARLGPFFQELRRNLASLAVRSPENPRIVLLTPGPANETFFEHAYLAQYLGCTLVQGDDLTVRDNCVYLKLLEGLQPVDVILRRLSDAFCDPLELRADSLLGVPGLVQAVRSGNVVVANALGAGWLETPALMPYLPTLCRHLLGEDLRLEGVPSWWCGTEKGLSHVLSNLNHMVIRPAFPTPRQQPIFGEALTKIQLADLRANIRSHPQLYVGQEQVPLSSTPAWNGRDLEPRHLVLRTFTAATPDAGYKVMPGGLCLISGTSDSLIVTMDAGGGSKDAWVLESTPEHDEGPPPNPGVALSRSGDIPSRTAENLYWLGRYLERVEGMVRLVRGCLVRLTESSSLEEVTEVPPLMDCLGPRAKPQGRSRVGLSWWQESIRFWVRDQDHPDGLASLLYQINRAAGTVRDRIPADSWRVLSNLKLPSPAPDELSDVQLCLEQLIISLWAFSGMASESMQRGHGWRFLDMGRRIERAIHTTRLLQTLTQPNAREGPLLEALLEICDSSRSYRRRYQAGVFPAAVVDILLADEINPRSVAFQLNTLLGHLEELPQDTRLPRRPLEQRLVLGLLTDVRLIDVEDRPQIKTLLKKLTENLPSMSDSLTQSYLSHLQPSQQLHTYVAEWRREV